MINRRAYVHFHLRNCIDLYEVGYMYIQIKMKNVTEEK